MLDERIQKYLKKEEGSQRGAIVAALFIPGGMLY
jgi:hypothetical protein